MRTILTGSMEKCKHEDPSEECDHVDVSKYEIGHLPVDTMIFIELVPEDKDKANEWYKNLKEGDVLTFQYTGMGVVTHRIIEIEPNSTGGYEIDLMGDNRGDDGTAGVQTIITNNADSTNRVIGKVVGQSVFLGKAVTIIRKPVGAIFVILVPCLLIVIVEVVKIIVVLTEDKRAKRKAQKEERKALEEKTETAREDIEELKKQIEQTKLALNSTDAPKDEPDGE
jgi:predicted nucleic acid-binding protein